MTKAVSDKAGRETLFLASDGSALNTLSTKCADSLKIASRKSIQTTTVDALISEYGMPFFIKIDVEGYEVNVLRGLRQPVPHLSFEVNPGFRAEGRECVDILKNVNPSGRFNLVADYGSGVVFPRWLSPAEFQAALNDYSPEGTVEVFWKCSQ